MSLAFSVALCEKPTVAWGNASAHGYCGPIGSVPSLIGFSTAGGGVGAWCCGLAIGGRTSLAAALRALGNLDVIPRPFAGVNLPRSADASAGGLQHFLPVRD